MNNPLTDLPKYLRIYQDYLGPKIYLILGLTVVAGLFEGIGILMFLPLLESLDTDMGSGNSGDPSVVSSYINEALLKFNLEGSILAVLAIIAVAFFVKGTLTFLALAYGAYLRGNLLKLLKMKLFSRLSEADYGYFSKRDTGYYVNLINEQVNLSMISFFCMCLLGGSFINAFVYLLFAFIVAWKFGLMALTSGIVLLFLFRTLNSYVRERSRKLAKENGHLAKLLIQTLQAFKYLVATNQTSKLQTKVNKSIGALAGLQINVGVANSLTTSVREPIAVILIISIMSFQLIALNQSLAPMLVSIVLFYRGLNSILMTQTNWQKMLEAIGSLEMVEREFVILEENKQKNGNIAIGPFAKTIKFENIGFSYDQDVQDVISSLDLEIPVNNTIALVGESGAGKSTLADLVTLILQPQIGSLNIDNISIHNLNHESWRDQIGYVSQDTVVFDDTVANNISLWDYDIENKDEHFTKVIEAARKAHLHHFIETLPEGYDTPVGDKGVRLSGGQKQRLFIARELYRKPNILILDEATSALDSESEKAIQNSIDELKGKVTLIIIAHRLSTIRNADTIYVLEQGKILEKGTFSDLLKDPNSQFSKMVELQKL